MKAASEAFAEHGSEVSVSQIAQRAVIGKGTVFRHFATDEDLLTASGWCRPRIRRRDCAS